MALIPFFLPRSQGDANRSDTDEDKTSTRFEEDSNKFRDLQPTGVRVVGGDWRGPESWRLTGSRPP